MTLALALRGSNGLVLASDSRMSGMQSKDDSTKFLQVNRDIGVMTYGLAIPGNAGIRKLREKVNQKQLAHFSQISSEAREVFFEEYKRFCDHLQNLEPPQYPTSMLGFILAGYDSYESNQFKIYSYESPDFIPNETTDIKAAQWHMSRLISDYLQYPQMTLNELKQLVVIQMLTTSAYEDTVGGPIQMATVSYSKGFHQLAQDEINVLVEKVQPKIQKFRSILAGSFYGFTD